MTASNLQRFQYNMLLQAQQPSVRYLYKWTFQMDKTKMTFYSNPTRSHTRKKNICSYTKVRKKMSITLDFDCLDQKSTVTQFHIMFCIQLRCVSISSEKDLQNHFWEWNVTFDPALRSNVTMLGCLFHMKYTKTWITHELLLDLTTEHSQTFVVTTGNTSLSKMPGVILFQALSGCKFHKNILLLRC